MPSVKKSLLCAAGALLAALLTSCGSSNSSTTPAYVRLVNTTDTSVTLTLNGGYNLSGIASGAVSGYESVPPGTYTVSVSATSAASPLQPHPQTLPLGTSQNYSTIAYARANAIYTFTITDNLVIPAAGFSTLNVANVSIDAGPLDVYLLPQGTNSLQGLAPSFPFVQGLSTAATFTSGTYNIVVTAAGNQSDVRFSLLTGVTLNSQQAATLALTDTSGGTLVNALVITQGGAVVSYPATQARVRVMPALPATPNAEVLVTVATNTTLAPAYSGLPTQYALVTAGASAVVTGVTVGGAAITTPLPAAAMSAGQDYTVLVYGDGTPGGTTAALLPDSNLVIPNFASVRVINGAATLAIAPGGVTLFVDGKQPASSVAYGTASNYAGVTPTSSASLQLIGGSYSCSLTGYNLVSGEVYTVFLYNAAPAIVNGVCQPNFLITADR